MVDRERVDKALAFAELVLTPWQRSLIDQAMDIDPDTGEYKVRRIIMRPRRTGTVGEPNPTDDPRPPVREVR